MHVFTGYTSIAASRTAGRAPSAKAFVCGVLRADAGGIPWRDAVRAVKAGEAERWITCPACRAAVIEQ